MLRHSLLLVRVFVLASSGHIMPPFLDERDVLTTPDRLSGSLGCSGESSSTVRLHAIKAPNARDAALFVYAHCLHRRRPIAGMKWRAMITQLNLFELSAIQHAVGSMTVQTETAVVFADGGSRGNPGPSGAGAVVTVNGETVQSVCKFVGVTTNNVAEYTGLIIGLEKALELGFTHVEVRMDSELVVKQMNGIYRVKNERLQPLYEQAKTLARRFSKFAIVHVRREHNKEADKLANEAMDRACI